MVKDYSLNPTATAESEDDEDPRTPTSISSQGSQGYDSSASSDFVDVEGFTVVPDSSMNELNIQVMRLDFTIRRRDLKVQLNLCTTTTLETPNLWSLLRMSFLF